MSYNHKTIGQGNLKAFLQCLELQGVKYDLEDLPAMDSRAGLHLSNEEEVLHKATFTIVLAGKTEPSQMIVEEYLQVQDCDCDGTSYIAIEVYEDGKRPDLESKTQVFEA